MGLDDHVVDQPNQRVVGLLDRSFIGLGVVVFTLECFDQLVGADGGLGLGVHALEAALPRPRDSADLVVGCVGAVVHRAALPEHGHHLHLRRELGLIDRRTPARRVVQRHHQPALKDQQRQQAQPGRHGVRQLAQRVCLDGERVDINQRIAHLARHRHLQVRPRDHAAAHQDLAQRHAAIELLLAQRGLQVMDVDHAQRHQRLADAHHGHARLLFERAHQLVGGDDVARDEDVADALFAHLHLLGGGSFDLIRRGGLLLDEQLADALPQIEGLVGAGRHEGAHDRT